jgi:hypothetical protein
MSPSKAFDPDVPPLLHASALQASNTFARHQPIRRTADGLVCGRAFSPPKTGSQDLRASTIDQMRFPCMKMVNSGVWCQRVPEVWKEPAHGIHMHVRPCTLIICWWLMMLPALAQKEQAGLGMSWNSLTLQFRAGEHLWIMSEGSMRRSQWFFEEMETMVRPHAEYRLNDNWRFAAGYAYFSSIPFGNFPADHIKNEHRPWQQITYLWEDEPWRITHRLRVEQRSVEQINTFAEGPMRTRNWEHRFRYRPMVEHRVDIDEDRDARRSFYFFGEILGQAGVQQELHWLDQWRVGAQFGIRPFPSFEVITGYMFVYDLAADASYVEMGHVLLLEMFLKLDLRRKRPKE